MHDEIGRDHVVRGLREQISDNDRLIVEAVNKRLQLVARLRDYKASRGYEFVDQAREDWMTAYLLRANRGPLTSEGLRELYGAVLDLTKREIIEETKVSRPLDEEEHKVRSRPTVAPNRRTNVNTCRLGSSSRAGGRISAHPTWRGCPLLRRPGQRGTLALAQRDPV